jgi:hypothetical protein
MNARKVMNGTLAMLLFAWSMAATLPALNSEVLSPFEAFVLTPALLMLAAAGGLGAYRGLDRLERRLLQGLPRVTRERVQRDSEAAGLDDCLTGRAR